MRGFTLIETMVAVTILTLSIAAPLFTADRAIVAAQIAGDQLTASYLAQEGIEYVRAVRDNEFLKAYQAGGAGVSTAAWNKFLGDVSACDTTVNAAQACTLDPMTGLSLSCSAGSSCTPLYLRGDGVYTQTYSSTYTKTKFTRTIQTACASSACSAPGGNTEERVTSTVSWDFHGTHYSVAVTDHLTPWQ